MGGIRGDETLDPSLMYVAHGKAVPTYGALLELAHKCGLTGIKTMLVQAPGPTNGGLAIVHATAVFVVDGTFADYTGLGDASVANVGRGVAPHIVRVAETRAKARALRDALCITDAALEEMGGADLVGDDKHMVIEDIPSAPSAVAFAPSASEARPASDKQVAYLSTLAARAKTSLDALGFDGTSTSASALIERLKGGK
jgi:hypothetical protein